MARKRWDSRPKRLKVVIKLKEALRFFSKIKEVPCNKKHFGSCCWEWQAGISSDGLYGIFLPEKTRQSIPAHRFSYAAFVGVIPEGYEIEHRCENKMCVNPAHLVKLECLDHARMTAEQRRARRLKALPPKPDDDIPI